MHEVAEEEIDVISLPTALFTQPDYINPTDISNTNTTLAKTAKTMEI